MRALTAVFCVLLLLQANAQDASNMIMKSLMEVQEINGDTSGAHLIKGKLNINGQQYSTLCDCSPNGAKQAFGGGNAANKAQCDPQKLKLHQDRVGEAGLTMNQVRDIIGYTEQLTYVNVKTSHFECLDGRNSAGILGTPGGDAGEFILGLLVYNDIVGQNRELTQEAVDNFFLSYLQRMPQDKFYMCTDDMAIAHLEKELSIAAVNIQHPMRQLQPMILQALTKPENVGCSHIKMMLMYEELYGVKKDLIQMFLKSFYKLLWDDENKLSEKLKLDQLVGNHGEGGFLEVRSNEVCSKAGIAPLINPREPNHGSTSIFVNHIDAASIRRGQIAQFFANEVNHHAQPLNVKMMHNRMNHHGMFFLENTGSYLAKRLPFYTINFV